VDKARPFCIAKREVWEAYKQVKANQGAAGVDEQSIAQFEEKASGFVSGVDVLRCSDASRAERSNSAKRSRGIENYNLDT
jgi:hypothetical protein